MCLILSYVKHLRSENYFFLSNLINILSSEKVVSSISEIIKSLILSYVFIYIVRKNIFSSREIEIYTQCYTKTRIKH